MLLKLKPLIINEHPSGMGVVYAGAHHGQCIDEFIQCGFNRILFIEPDPGNCAIIESKMKAHPGIVYAIANCASGSHEFRAGMYTEIKNNGQSNSLLRPKLHVKQYPDIVFSDTPTGEFIVKPIDQIIAEHKMYPHQFHMLYMDIQGYELEALKGATDLLKSVNYVYSEVSREELYEGCALMPDVEKYLTNLQFELKAVDWSGSTWGDALFERKIYGERVFTQQPGIINEFFSSQIKKTQVKNGAVIVPSEFQQAVRKPYPEDNLIIFEQYFENFWNFSNNPNEIAYPDNFLESAVVMDNIRQQQKIIKRVYLPVFWTSYYMNNGYASDKQAMQKLQDFLNTLDPSLKYFTIVQYDDGILNDLSHIDCHVFGMGGGKMNTIIPLVSQARPCVAAATGSPRKYLANFIGKITHPVRQEIIDKLTDKYGFYISTNYHSIADYSRIMAESYFTLAPRGYGATSFRIKEAYEQGSIPVYISDKHLIPNVFKYHKNKNSKSRLTDDMEEYKIEPLKEFVLFLDNKEIMIPLILAGIKTVDNLPEFLDKIKTRYMTECVEPGVSFIYSFKALAAQVISFLSSLD